MDFLFYLQGWIGMVGLMAFGNTFMCFRDHEFLSSRLYTGANDQGLCRNVKLILTFMRRQG